MTPETPQLRVLVYQEDGEWVAHLLEMDLVGTGSSIDEAQDQLLQALEAQITYCMQHALSPFHPAPSELFERWEEMQRKELESFVMDSDSEPHSQSPLRAGFIPAGPRSSYQRDGWASQLCPG